MDVQQWIKSSRSRRQALTSGYVATDPSRCVQCGICTYHCPVGIDVRRYAWVGKSIYDSYCLTCGECVARCPRSALHFEENPQFGNLESR